MRFVTLTNGRRDQLRIPMPPGFAQGRAGAFVRATRAMVRLSENGQTQSVYEHLQDSPDEQSFQNASSDMRISDVLDLTWMAAGRLELRSIQELLERLSSAVLPEVETRFSKYDEPRYRAALQLQVGSVLARAACGGVLAKWPERPEGVDAAHVRIFLEPWAAVQAGQAIGLDSLPGNSTLRL